jgi:ligand-binding SRPBCC domain-containing protein
MMVAFRVLPYLPVHERWVVKISEFLFNQYFQDVQTQGPFRQYQHTHSFESMPQGGVEGTLIRDEVEYEVGFGAVGRALEMLVFQQVFRSTFSYRKRAVDRIFRAPVAVPAAS